MWYAIISTIVIKMVVTYNNTIYCLYTLLKLMPNFTENELPVMRDGEEQEEIPSITVDGGNQPANIVHEDESDENKTSEEVPSFEYKDSETEDD